MDASWIGVVGVSLGATLAGLVALAQTRLQAKIQAESIARQAEIQEANERKRLSFERWKWHADLRRQSYIECILSVEQCSNFIEVLEKSSQLLAATNAAPVLAERDEVTLSKVIAAFNRRMSEETFDRLQIVRLDGPDGVTLRARKLLDSLQAYWAASRIMADPLARPASYGPEEHGEFMRLFQDFRRDVNSFIAAASESLAQAP